MDKESQQITIGTDRDTVTVYKLEIISVICFLSSAFVSINYSDDTAKGTYMCIHSPP